MSKTRTKHVGSMYLKEAYILSKQWGDSKMADTVKSFNAGKNITLKKPFFCPNNGEGLKQTLAIFYIEKECF